jgi:hypothetical protein
MWRWRGWRCDGRLGREGGGGVGGSGERVCVRLNGLGSVGWGWRNTGWTEKRLVEGLAMEEGFVFLFVTEM